MALNSLYPGGWFALGAAALKVNLMICIMLIFYLLGFCTITIVNDEARNFSRQNSYFIL